MFSVWPAYVCVCVCVCALYACHMWKEREREKKNNLSKIWHMHKCLSSEENPWSKHVAWHNIIFNSVASSILTAARLTPPPPRNLFTRCNLEVLGTFSLPSCLSVDLELIEEPEDAGLTDRPLRLVASLFWFVCAVLLLVRGEPLGPFP